jgi:ankyrin repeat protein
LDETYQAALDRIGNDDIGMRALKWVTCAKRHLEAKELQHALAVEPTTRDIDKDDLIEVVDLVSRCAGLVTFDSESGIFRLVHYTTQTFLQDRLQVEGNAEIATTCLRYLSFPRFSNHFPHLVSMDSCLMNYELARYAGRYWYKHVRGTSETEFHSQILETFGTQRTRDLVFRIMDKYDYESSISILLLVSMCGLPSLCRKVLDDDDLNSKMKYVSFCHCYKLTTRTKESGHEPTLGFDSIIEEKDFIYRLSSLGWAAKNGEVEVVRLLLDRGAKVDPQALGGISPLFCAASNGHIEVMKLLLSNGANVDAQDVCGQSALYSAVERGDIEIVKFLLEMGANIHLAMSTGGETVKPVLDGGASVDAQGADRDFPIHAAIRRGQLEMVKLLLDKGAHIESQGYEWSPLCLAAWTVGHRSKSRSKSLKNRSKIVKLLLDRGANVNWQDKEGNSILHLVAWKGQMEMVQLLVEMVQLLVDRGANVNWQDKDGNSMLHLVAWEGHMEMVQLLVDRGANVKAQNGEGWSPLMAAAAGGHVEVVKLLLNAGANANVRWKKGDISLLLDAVRAVRASHSKQNNPGIRHSTLE